MRIHLYFGAVATAMTSQRLSIQSVALSAAVFPQFQCQVLGPQFDLPLGRGLWWTQGIENGTNRNLVLTFIFDFNTHYRTILDRLATMHNAADRQPDRAMAIGRPCYSISGLNTVKK